jgi:peptide/nickel transport system substrate-binding protein
MFTFKRGLLLASLLLIGLFIVACQPQEVIREVPVEVEVTRIITETITEGGQTVEVTRTIQETIIVTATPAPEREVSFVSPRGDSYTAVTFGDPDTLDPALAYDTASATLIQNILEPLLYYNHKDATTYVPVLATDWEISDDGLTYVFHIREGVKFSNGNDLTASDFAYSFHRGLLQSDPNGPQWLLLEPILGLVHDITENIDEGAYEGDRDALIAGAQAEDLVAVCQQVKAAVVADDAAGTLTFNLNQPWGPFLATLAQTWGAALDKEWSIENGAWDDDCGTWQNWYAPGAENDELSTIIMGTGPYMLERWVPDEEYVLVANPNYWRQAGDEMWPGGPSGLAQIKTVIVKNVSEWGTRFAMLRAGDAEAVAVPPANRPQVDAFVGEICDFRTDECQSNPDNPNGPLRKWGGLPSTSRTDIFLNFRVNTDEQGNNPYIGSGRLDGNGVPPDFFSDVHVRRAFNYCFDYDTYIKDAQNGEGVRNSGVIILDMLGYNPDQEMYMFDRAKCAEELAQAHGGVLPDTGFRLQIAFNTGNTTRQTAAAILQANLAAVNPRYQVDIVGLPWPTFLRSFRAGQLPVSISGWIEDIHDPHNWVQPYLVGTFAGRQNMPDELKATFQELIDAGVAATDPAEREAIYFELGALRHEHVPNIVLSQLADVRYEQRWVQDWYFNSAQFGPYYYAYSLNTR